MIAKRLAAITSIVVLLASGTYLFVYLYRWEWNRALIAGVFLIVAEIGLVGAMLIDRLRSLERRMSNMEMGTSRRETLEEIERSAPKPKQRFKWLMGGGELHVFVPVLMGAGVLFSAIAWVMERVARTTARPALERGLEARLVPLALPEGGFLAPVAAPAAPMNLSFFRRYRALIAMVVISMMGIFAIKTLGDLTQNRPDAPVLGGNGVITLQIQQRDYGHSDMMAARNLWGACSTTLSRRFQANSFTRTGQHEITFVVEPAFGRYAERRLTGCLDDATLDNMQARVKGIVTTTN
jgi:hypothetical protein